MENQSGVWVVHEEMFVDELSINLLYNCRGKVDEYQNNNRQKITRKDVAEWILQNYYNEKKYKEWYNINGHGRDIDEKKLYNYDEEYRTAVDEERIYLLHLIGYNNVEIGEAVGYVRQTVAKKIKAFEEERLQEFIKW